MEKKAIKNREITKLCSLIAVKFLDQGSHDQNLN